MTDDRKTVISVKNLKKTYGKGEGQFQALKGVDIDIYEGETVAIVGKSGSGKSTLMHLMALLDAPDEGEIFVEGKDSKKLKTKELNTLRNETFGFIFQQFFLNPGGSVQDNVELPLKIAGIGRKERKQRSLEALKALELDAKAKNRATALSGGQKQRTCIARALVNNPSIIFADEFTGNLDSQTGAIVEDIVFNLNKERGITVVIVTHDAELAAKCDRQIELRDGLIIDVRNNAKTQNPDSGQHGILEISDKPSDKPFENARLVSNGSSPAPSFKPSQGERKHQMLEIEGAKIANDEPSIEEGKDTTPMDDSTSNGEVRS